MNTEVGKTFKKKEKKSPPLRVFLSQRNIRLWWSKEIFLFNWCLFIWHQWNGTLFSIYFYVIENVLEISLWVPKKKISFGIGGSCDEVFFSQNLVWSHRFYNEPRLIFRWKNVKSMPHTTHHPWAYFKTAIGLLKAEHA